MLSKFQHAVLQEMGIPVWVRQDTQGQSTSPQPNEPATTVTKPVQDKTAHLAALRKQLGDKTATADKPAKADNPPTPIVMPLSADARQAEIFKDIERAVGYSTVGSINDYAVGSGLHIDGQRLVLPCEPAKMTPSQKRALWVLLTTSGT
ncbi:hypothetical protein [Alteromonas sp. CYL-A6]|uniref:hypothetical protein n=1 Tax=Alteromonas nitratireducens TaxID=3390813 RepID=UPI0034AF3608